METQTSVNMSEVSRTQDSREDFIRDVIITAVEGGINYWAFFKSGTYKPDEGTITLAETDNDGYPLRDSDKKVIWHEVNASVIERGIAAILAGGVQISPDILEQIRSGSVSNDAGEIDAAGADCCVQAGLMDELRYS